MPRRDATLDPSSVNILYDLIILNMYLLHRYKLNSPCTDYISPWSQLDG